jgi:hypothetical protein
MNSSTNTRKQHCSSNIPGIIILRLIQYFSGDSGQELMINIYTVAVDGLIAMSSLIGPLM